MGKRSDIIYFHSQGLTNVEISRKVECTRAYVTQVLGAKAKEKQAPVAVLDKPGPAISKREALDKFLDGDTEPLDEMLESLSLKDAAGVYRMLEAARRERRQSEKLEQDDTIMPIGVLDDCLRWGSRSLGTYFRLGEDDSLTQAARRWGEDWLAYIRATYPGEVEKLRKAGYRW